MGSVNPRALIGPGTVLLGEYAVEATLEELPTRIVYLATRVGRPLERFHACALTHTIAERLDLIEAFARQSLLLASLRHPGIVSVVAAGVDHGAVVMITPEVEGITLRKRLDDARGPLAPGEVVRLIRELAAALEFLHKRTPPILHRLIEPTNILLSPSRHPLLKDVGYAHALHAVQIASTEEIVPVVAAPYRAPEIAEGGKVGPEADQFALASVAYECIVGRPRRVPDEGEDEGSVTEQMLHPGLDSVLRRATATRPSERYASVVAFAEALTKAAMEPDTAPSIGMGIPVFANPRVSTTVGAIGGAPVDGARSKPSPKGMLPPARPRRPTSLGLGGLAPADSSPSYSEFVAESSTVTREVPVPTVPRPVAISDDSTEGTPLLPVPQVSPAAPSTADAQPKEVAPPPAPPAAALTPATPVEPASRVDSASGQPAKDGSSIPRLPRDSSTAPRATKAIVIDAAALLRAAYILGGAVLLSSVIVVAGAWLAARSLAAELRLLAAASSAPVADAAVPVATSAAETASAPALSAAPPPSQPPPARPPPRVPPAAHRK
jgi:serine/threonine protein kinase